jgi:hypothetical protein
MLQLINKIENSKWYHNRVDNIDNIHISITRKLKYLNKIIFGKGRMIKKYDYIIRLYDRKNTNGLLLFRDFLINTLPNFWELSYHKYIELINFIDFIIRYDKINNNLKDKYVNDTIKSLNITHEIGYLIKNKIIEIHELFLKN